MLCLCLYLIFCAFFDSIWATILHEHISYMYTQIYLYALSRTTALYCKCIKQKNGNIPLTNIIAYIIFLNITFFTFLLVLYIAFLCLRSFHSCLLFFFLSWFHEMCKKTTKRIIIIIIITKYHCPVALLKIYICVYIYLCYGSSEIILITRYGTTYISFYSLKSKFFVCLAFWWFCDVASVLWNFCCCQIAFLMLMLLLLWLFCLFLVFHIINLFHLTTSPKEWNNFHKNTTKLFNCVKILE